MQDSTAARTCTVARLRRHTDITTLATYSASVVKSNFGDVDPSIPPRVHPGHLNTATIFTRASVSR